ncbi:hypothetical protein [Xenorhabdus bovienii]|uniref:hypothetical protein n=1 Tax=Xenorhabdus bovienii TaxID=40576 RepID=UPI0023B3076B|nr:hypothetical protein [Xenorhabdus bovienii]MDE9453611.1 hypothetical protein [Xenorhabdus bovienii]MDE9542789.1 hypothetical protein [Xenorhabdus bovienii]MDE9552089.1 hypothetical protein [Xenorhabdus bovienii]MDE9563013.1 hypothetical protein [Xenorhabdus bovienii]
MGSVAKFCLEPATSRFSALMDIDFLPEPDQFDIAIILVIENPLPLFGLILKKQF